MAAAREDEALPLSGVALSRSPALAVSMAYHPYVSVLCIHSGVRRYSYVSSRSPEHERAYKWITAGPEERLALMQCVAVQEASELVTMRTERARVVRPLRTSMESALEKLGIHPSAMQRYF